MEIVAAPRRVRTILHRGNYIPSSISINTEPILLSSITYVPNSMAPAYNTPSTMSPISPPTDRADSFYSPKGYQAEPTSPYQNGAKATYGQWGNPSRDAARLTPEYTIGDYRTSPVVPDAALPAIQGGMAGIHTQRRPSNRDEFDGPHQVLPRPGPDYLVNQERDLPHLPTNLVVQEQDDILYRVNDRLSRCAFDFVAKYEFPIPIEQSKRPVQRPEDREWTEWVYLLKRLATKRRIPARVLYNNQIKQFITVLENSLEMKHAARNQSRPLKDDRNILQLISAGIQVAKILKDAAAMDYLDRLYSATEQQIHERREAQKGNRYR